MLEVNDAAASAGSPGRERARTPAARSTSVRQRLAEVDALAAAADAGDARGVPLLCEALQDRSPAVRLAAARALEKCADERAAPALREELDYCLSRSKLPPLWLSLAFLLLFGAVFRRGFNPNAILFYLFTTQAASALVGEWIWQSSARSDLALALAGGLARIVDRNRLSMRPDSSGAMIPRTVPAPDRCETEPDTSSDEALEAPAKDLRSVIVRRRIAAVRRLGELPFAGSTPLLVEALSDRVVEVRSAAAEALERVGVPLAAPALCKALEDRDYSVRLAAARALERLADEDCLPAIRVALANYLQKGNWAARALPLSLGILFGSLMVSVVPLLIIPNSARLVSGPSAFVPLLALVPLSMQSLSARRNHSPLARSLARALSRIADSAPAPAARAALDSLQQLARDRAGQDPETLAVSRRVVARIEERTGALKDLPTPSAAAVPVLAGLPSPATAHPGDSWRVRNA